MLLHARPNDGIIFGATTRRNMVSPELPHDVNSPTHPVSAMDYMPVEPLRALQLHRLQWTVKYAYERVPLFRKRCEERGVRPEHVKTLKDIRLLPFSMKTDLRDEYPLGLQAAPTSEIVRFHCSSGDSGFGRGLLCQAAA